MYKGKTPNVEWVTIRKGITKVKGFGNRQSKGELFMETVIEKEYYTIKDIMEATGIARATISQKIQLNEFKPCNREYMHMDGGYLFEPQEYQRIVEKYKKVGLTTGEVAKMLGYSISTVHKLIEREELPVIEKAYGKQMRKFIKNEDVLSYIEQHGKKDTSTIYFEKEDGTHYFLYQPLTYNSKDARIIELEANGNGKVLLFTGEEITLDEAERIGYTPSIVLEDKAYNNKKGWVDFEFQIPKYFNSPIFTIMELLFTYAGYKNIQVSVNDITLIVSVKPVILENFGITNDVEEVGLMKQCLKSGQIRQHRKGLVLQSNLVDVPATFEVELKLEMEEIVKNSEQYSSMKEFIALAVKEKIEREKEG